MKTTTYIKILFLLTAIATSGCDESFIPTEPTEPEHKSVAQAPQPVTLASLDQAFSALEDRVDEIEITDLPELRELLNLIDTRVIVLESESPEQATPPAEPIAGGKVNINIAGLQELDTLPGIGPAYAQRIIDYRVAYGDFVAVDDLVKIKGIGPKTLEKLRPYACAGDDVEVTQPDPGVDPDTA